MKINCRIRCFLFGSLITSLFWLNGCSLLNGESEQFMAIAETLKVPPTNGKLYYLLIPVDGCGKCVDKSIEFAKQHTKNSLLRIILVSNYGYKNAALRYVDDLPSHYVIDAKGKLIIAKFVDGYVTLIEIENKSIALKKTLSPQDVDKDLAELDKLLNHK